MSIDKLCYGPPRSAIYKCKCYNNSTSSGICVE